MNTIKAEDIFKQAMKKAGDPRCGEIVDSGTAHDVLQFAAEVSGGITDEQLEAWIRETAIEVAGFERKRIDALLEVFKDRGIDRSAVRLVRRTPPNVKRTRNEHGEMCWRISARVGTRVEPYPKADPRSSRSRAIEDAKVQEKQAEEREKKLSEILESMP